MNAEQQLLIDAVKQKEVSKRQSVLQKLFAVWFDAFVYNQIWEDPRVDLEALQLDENTRVLTISSGGCNALNYLVENPESVTAVDLNRHHIYLLNLKIAALKFLPTYQDFFAFFGFGKSEKNIENYQKFIAPNLDKNTKKFWEGSSFFGKLSHGRRINFFKKGGLYEHSRNGYFLRFFHRFAHLVGCKPEEVLKAETPEEQEELYQKFIAPFFDSFLIQLVGKLPVTMFGLGIPPQQYAELKKDLADGGNVIDIYRERTRRLAVEYPIYENYFAWQAFARRYDTENRQAIPEYLKEENYEALKANAGKIRTKIGSVTEEIKNQPTGSFNRFVFLDAQDWMNAEMMTELWQAIAGKSESGSRIIFRTAGAVSPIEKNLPENLREKFVYEEEFSRELFTRDRASIYGGFHLYILK
jgi:S-adenosylmethionine-diacylglycerol 3-amino-3-carboxypropyl transferase